MKHQGNRRLGEGGGKWKERGKRGGKRIRGREIRSQRKRNGNKVEGGGEEEKEW